MVDIEVNSGGSAGQAPVHVVVALGQTAQTIIQNDYVLSPTGATVIPLTPPGGGFAPGNYSVTITYGGELVGFHRVRRPLSARPVRSVAGSLGLGRASSSARSAALSSTVAAAALSARYFGVLVPGIGTTCGP